MIAISRDTVVVRRPDVLSTRMGEETVMVSIDQGHYYGLNVLGGRAWELMQEPVSVDSLCHQLESEYEVSHADCENAVLEFLSELARNGLVSAS